MNSEITEAARPFVFINVATTADGKLAPGNRHFVPFGSRRDQEHLLELRATADAVMAGARTLDMETVNLGPGPAKYRRRRLKNGLAEYNLRVIVSGSASIDPDSEIFKHRFSPIILLASGRAPEANLERLRGLADEVKIFGADNLDFAAALRWLREKWDVKRLLCEGGGELNAGLFEAGLIDEINLTLCPLVLGGRHAPTMADGAGFIPLAVAPRLETVSSRRIGDEVFLRLKVKQSTAGNHE